MAYPGFSRRSYSGIAPATTLSVNMGVNDTSFTVASVYGWFEANILNTPTATEGQSSNNALGTSGTFVVAVDYGTANEEKILCSAVDFSTRIVTVWVDPTNSSFTGRGYDGTANQAHNTGGTGTVVPVFTAVEAGIANYAVQQTVGQIVSAGDILQGSGANTLGVLTAGTAGTVLTSNGSGSALSWSTFAQPSGTLLDFAGGTVPAGFLACDGTAVSRSTYSALFAVIGTTWGSGNGTTTFNVPDLRGRATIGAGTGSGLTARTLAATTGVETVTLTAAQSGTPSHTHAAPLPYGSSGSSIGFVLSPNANNNGNWGTNDTTPASASQSHNNMQPSAVVTKIIKY
jgi:microcystin-dependent protein